MSLLRVSAFLTSAFMAIASQAVGEDIKTLSLFSLPNQANSKNAQRQQYVDLHAILLTDVSSSMKSNEIARSTDGLFMYLVSDEAKQDYANGTSKAVTLMYFAGEMHVEDTKVISSTEDAENLIATYLHVVSHNSQDTRILLSNGERLEGGTNVDGALKRAGQIFAQEEAVGIYTERRVVVIVGDDVPKLQIDYARDESNTLTQKYGARVCAVAVHDYDTPVPAYHKLVTSIDPFTLEPVIFMNQYGHATSVNPCDVSIARKPQEVKLAVSQALGMARN